MIVAALGSLIVGYILIALGILGIGVGIVVAALEAVKDALKPVTTLGADGQAPPGFEIPWDKIFELLKELLKLKAGVPLVLGLVSLSAGITVLKYDWF